MTKQQQKGDALHRRSELAGVPQKYNIREIEQLELSQPVMSSCPASSSPASHVRSSRSPIDYTPKPRLNAGMACDAAFRIIARRYLKDLNLNHEATCNGDPTGLHKMRIALTHLRSAIRFFSPMVDDATRAQVMIDLKWLNAQLGTVRDLDVAIERIKTTKPKQPQIVDVHQLWVEKRNHGHRVLARALRSDRYQRLVERTSEWIDNGRWSRRNNKQSARGRASPVAEYGIDRLTEWEKKLLKKRRKLWDMSVEKRHRLRLLNKKLNYSIEAFEDLFAEKVFSKQKAALKPLRKAQRYLGQLNDDARGLGLAAALKRDGVETPLHFIGAKREERLIRKAAEAYHTLAKLTK
jgi:CHAD domain-containing protein